MNSTNKMHCCQLFYFNEFQVFGFLAISLYGGKILEISLQMTAISGYAGLSRHHMSLGKGIAVWTVSMVMQCDLALLSIGGTYEGDDYN